MYTQLEQVCSAWDAPANLVAPLTTRDKRAPASGKPPAWEIHHLGDQRLFSEKARGNQGSRNLPSDDKMKTEHRFIQTHYLPKDGKQHVNLRTT